ncbi:MAG: hypothetical protein ACFFDP_09995 [Promethearchaeota archaeon]
MSDEIWQQDVYTVMDLEDAQFVVVEEEEDGEMFDVAPVMELADAQSAAVLESNLRIKNSS